MDLFRLKWEQNQIGSQYSDHLDPLAAKLDQLCELDDRDIYDGFEILNECCGELWRQGKGQEHDYERIGKKKRKEKKGKS